MTEDERYNGGHVVPHAEEPAIVSDMGDYIIPASFAHMWGQELLDRLHEGVVD